MKKYYIALIVAGIAVVVVAILFGHFFNLGISFGFGGFDFSGVSKFSESLNGIGAEKLFEELNPFGYKNPLKGL